MTIQQASTTKPIANAIARGPAAHPFAAYNVESRMSNHLTGELATPSQDEQRAMKNLIRFRVRPEYHGSKLLVEMFDDHRTDDFPNIAAILRDELNAVRIPHPGAPNAPMLALSQDYFFSYWKYSGGEYEIDDDIWTLFVIATVNNASTTADIERALLRSGKFVKEEVDFDQFK